MTKTKVSTEAPAMATHGAIAVASSSVNAASRVSASGGAGEEGRHKQDQPPPAFTLGGRRRGRGLLGGQNWSRGCFGLGGLGPVGGFGRFPQEDGGGYRSRFLRLQ